MSDLERRIPAAWWCDQHNVIHLGTLDYFSMEHRIGLHPVYVHLRWAYPSEVLG